MPYRLKLLLQLFPDWWLGFVTHFAGDSGERLRYRYWKGRLKNLGDGVRIGPGVQFVNPEFISIDDGSWIDKDVVIIGGVDRSSREIRRRKNKAYPGEPGEVFIGKNVHVGIGTLISGIDAGVYISDDCGFSAHCKVYGFAHHYRSFADPTNRNISFGPLVAPDRQVLISRPVVLGRNTGVSLNSIILPGANLGEDCFVSVNSVVFAGNFRSNSIIEGSPAKIQDVRFTEPKSTLESD